MGLEVNKTEFSSQEFVRFRAKLFQNLDALKALLQQPDFGQGKSTVGAELELYIVDVQGRPLSINDQIQKRLGDPQLTLELNRYNLEYNLTPVAVCGRPFSQIENEITDVLQRLNRLALEHDGQVVPIGILPTLQRSDFGPHAMTDLSRRSPSRRSTVCRFHLFSLDKSWTNSMLDRFARLGSFTCLAEFLSRRR